MKIKNILFLGFIFVLILLFWAVKTIKSATDDEFSVSRDVTYEVLADSGVTAVTNKITLTNKLTNVYATSYTLILNGIKPLEVSAKQGEVDLGVNTLENEKGTEIAVAFPDSLVGKGKTREFSVNFKLNDLVSRNGQVWEVTIPKASDPDAAGYSVTLVTPNSLGKPAYISPEPQKRDSKLSKNIYTFKSDDLKRAGVSAAFGEFQIFSFRLSYHLENPLKAESTTQIALPPDTDFQKVFYLSLTPKPLNVEADADGNWLASYKLNKRERIDVVAQGQVQIFAYPWRNSGSNKQNLENYLKPTSVWQSDDPGIRELANKLANPAQIYNWVVSNLSYDYTRVRPNIERKGAVAALATPANSICMEFTDLFIALARAAGIPAREINGFAYTDNPKIQPLSLVADVLHSWPEYWDKNRGQWIPVDPTWGATTAGVDYFNKLDLNHFAFVIHGSNYQKPYPAGSYKLGDNPQKDVVVSFDTLPQTRVSHPEIKTTFIPQLSPFSDLVVEVKISNPGPVALYDVPVQVYFDASLAFRQKIEILPPLSNITITASQKPKFFNLPTQVKVFVADDSITTKIPLLEILVRPLVFSLLVFLAIGTFTVAILIKRRRAIKNAAIEITNEKEGP